MFKVEYAEGVVKDLRHLPHEFKRRALDIIEQDLSADPHLGKPLSGSFKGLLKFRVGDYRIIYSIEKDRLTIFVLRIRHRKDVYRGL